MSLGYLLQTVKLVFKQLFVSSAGRTVAHAPFSPEACPAAGSHTLHDTWQQLNIEAEVDTNI